MATTFFNYGLSALVDSLAENSGIIQIWYCDDGYIYGSVESVLNAWRKIKQFGPTIGYWPNSKSTIYDLEVSNKLLWENEGLTYSENGLIVLGSPVGNKFFWMKKWQKHVFEAKNHKKIDKKVLSWPREMIVSLKIRKN